MSSLKSSPEAPSPASAGHPKTLGLAPPAPGARWSALVADGDPQSRARLVRILEGISGVFVSGESAAGSEALEAVRTLRPQGIFLEVESPELSGFEVLAALEPGVRPEAVLLTSDPRHAAAAYETDAADCVVKPYSPERIAAAVRRAQARRSPAGEPARPRRLEDWLLVKREGRTVFLRVADIDWIESARNNVLLHVGAERYVHHETTSGIEARLSPNKFLRIHRSAIVRIERIKDLVPWFNGDYRVTLKDGTSLTLSEGYRDRLRRFRT